MANPNVPRLLPQSSSGPTRQIAISADQQDSDGDSGSWTSMTESSGLSYLSDVDPEASEGGLLDRSTNVRPADAPVTRTTAAPGLDLRRAVGPTGLSDQKISSTSNEKSDQSSITSLPYLFGPLTPETSIKSASVDEDMDHPITMDVERPKSRLPTPEESKSSSISDKDPTIIKSEIFPDNWEPNVQHSFRTSNSFWESVDNSMSRAGNVPVIAVTPAPQDAEYMGGSTGIPEDSPLWQDYIAEANIQDKENITNWSQTMDVLLVFAALFSAILTAFIIEFYRFLQPDSDKITVDLLRNLTMAVQGVSITVGPDIPFQPQSGSLLVNALWFASLSFSLGTAMAAILVKQWLQFYTANLDNGTIYHYATQRQHRYNALARWKVPIIISMLPLLLQLAVVLFALGLIIQLWQVNLKIAYVVLSLIAALISSYILALVLPLVYTDCPYKSSATFLLGEILEAFKLPIRDILQRLSFYKSSSLLPSNRAIQDLPGSLIKSTSGHIVQDPRVQLESILWLTNSSQKALKIDSALAAISQLKYTPDMVEKFLQYDIITQLVYKACAPLPVRSSPVWQQLHTASGISFVVHKFKDHVPYMLSLINIWLHPIYLSKETPPSMKLGQQSSSYFWVLGDWLWVWRVLWKNNNGNLTWLIENKLDVAYFSTVICTEALHYHIHSKPPTLPKIYEMTSTFNMDEPNPFYDLYALLQVQSTQDVNLPEDVIVQLLSTMNFIICKVKLLEDMEFIQKLSLLYLQIWGKYENHYLVCNRLVTAFDLILQEKENITMHYPVSMGSLQASFIKHLSVLIKMQVAILSGQGSNEDTQRTKDLIFQAATKLYLATCHQSHPNSLYDPVLLSLPKELIDRFSENLVKIQNSSWASLDQLQWHIHLLFSLFSQKNIGFNGKIAVIHCLQDILAWQSSRISSITERIFRYCFVKLEQTNENQVADLICHTIWHAIETDNENLLSQFNRIDGASHIYQFLHTTGSSESQRSWKHLQSHIKMLLTTSDNQKGSNILALCKTLLESLTKHQSNSLHSSGILVRNNLQNLPSTKVMCATISSHSPYLATCAWNNTVYIWNTTTGDLVSEQYPTHNKEITALGFSFDGKQLVSGSSDATLCVTNVITKIVQGPVAAHKDHITTIAFSPDGIEFASGSCDKSIIIWDAESVAPLIQLESHSDGVNTIAYSSNGQYIASGLYNGSIYIWDAETGDLKSKFQKEHPNFITSISFWPDTIYAIASSWDGTVLVLDTHAGELLFSWKTHPSIPSKNKELDTHVWAPNRNKIRGVSACAYSSDGHYTVSGSWNGEISIWNAYTGKQMIKRPYGHHHEPISAINFSPSGQFIVTGSNRTIKIWNISTEEMTISTGKTILAIENGPTLPDNFLISNAHPNGPTLPANFLISNAHSATISSVVFSEDESFIASGSLDHSICIWNVENGALVLGPLKGHSKAITCLNFSPNGEYMASGSSDNTICIWNARNGALVLKPLLGHKEPITSVMFTPDGQHLFSKSLDNSIQIWDAASGARVAIFVDLISVFSS